MVVQCDAHDRCDNTSCPHYGPHEPLVVEPHEDDGIDCTTSTLCEYLRLYRGVKGRARRVQCMEIEAEVT